jgi:hypothetical protein
MMHFWNHVDCSAFGKNYYLPAIILDGPTIQVKSSRRKFQTSWDADEYARRWYERVIRFREFVNRTKLEVMS